MALIVPGYALYHQCMHWYVARENYEDIVLVVHIICRRPYALQFSQRWEEKEGGAWTEDQLWYWNLRI